jgi:hypothetical protein
MALWVVLGVLALARAALAFVPSMWAWGLNALRFVPPVPGWLLWAVSAVALVPALARRLEPLAVAGGNPAAPAWRAYTPWILVAALAAWWFPDRLYFVGDFLLRETTSGARASVLESLYPQGFPLDLVLHDTAVRALTAVAPLEPNEVARLLGAIEAALLGAIAVRFTRVAGLEGAAAIGAAAIVLWGGYLSLFTGYNKAFAELTLLTAAVGAFGMEAVARGSGLLPMGAALGLALLMHRLAIGLLPGAAAVWVLWLMTHGRAGAWRRPGTIVAFVIPLGALAAILPHLPRLAGGIDAGNFLPAGARGPGGILAAAWSGHRPLDLANLLVFLSPAVPALLAALFLIGAPGAEERPGSAHRRHQGLVLIALAGPLLLLMPFFHPPQGLFRDWDAFAAGGVAASLGVAWLVGRVIESAPRFRWLGPAIALGVAAPMLHVLVLHTRVDAGLARIQAYLAGPPARSEQERATTWDYLGARILDLGRREEAAAAFAQAAALTPSPRILREWAATELLCDRPERAAAIYRRLLDRKPDDLQAWVEYAMLSARFGDVVEARRAAERALALKPDDRRARAILESLEGGP